MTKHITLNDRIFIAGASGMAGNSIYRKLSQAGYGKPKLGGHIYTPSSKELNLLNTEEVNNWFKRNTPSVVIHAAAKVGGIYANSCQPADFILENIKIQTNVIEAAWKNKVKRLLFLGSSCIYPKFANQPIKEESLLQGELESTNEMYAISKIAGLKLCKALRLQYDFDAICLMPTNLYGPGDNYHPKESHVFPALIRRFYEAVKQSSPSVTCWGSGDPLREFLHVDDFAEACLFTLENWDPSGADAPRDKDGNPLYHLNVGTGKDISIKDLTNKIASETGFSGKIFWDKSKPDGTPKKQLDITQIKRLGWESKISLNEGIKSVVKLFQEEINKNSIRI